MLLNDIVLITYLFQFIFILFYAQQIIDECSRQPRMKDFLKRKTTAIFFLLSISCEFSSPFIPLSLNLTKMNVELKTMTPNPLIFSEAFQINGVKLLSKARTHIMNPATFQ